MVLWLRNSVLKMMKQTLLHTTNFGTCESEVLFLRTFFADFFKRPRNGQKDYKIVEVFPFPLAKKKD